ncbi:MAG: hypothetical protein E7599_01970 [Ruminococcaceae bacterium]|nr:hypothetical protein [Oscillospiraceae bacterium]
MATAFKLTVKRHPKKNVFDPTFFQKGWRGQGRVALGAPFKGRNFSAFLFCQAFFFVPVAAKEKSGLGIL